MTEISIAKQFSPTPGGRTNKDGPYSGEAFRDRILRRAFQEAKGDIVIDLDGVAGLPPSFLEEAFGGLVRLGITTVGEFEKRVRFKASSVGLRAREAMIKRFVREAGLAVA